MLKNWTQKNKIKSREELNNNLNIQSNGNKQHTKKKEEASTTRLSEIQKKVK